MQEEITRYELGGGIRKIAGPGDIWEWLQVTERASYVEPISPVLRPIYWFGRKWLGNWFYMWSHGWKCQWRAKVLIGDKPILGPFPSRYDAILAEIQWLNANWVLVKESAHEQ